MRCHFTLAQAKRAAAKIGIRWDRARFTPHDLLRGMRVESEHSDVTRCSPTMTAKIARAHLRERPDYYQRLKKVERG